MTKYRKECTINEVKESDNILYKKFLYGQIKNILYRKSFTGQITKAFDINRSCAPKYNKSKEENKKYSNNSFKIAIGSDKSNEKDVANKLIDVFGIADYELFHEKFHEAVSGDGQELSRVNVFHSSSLIALLCFYAVKKKNLTIKLDKRDAIFDDVAFEQKNEVSNGHCSNIDVMLSGHYKDDDKNVILFLESKFSEYLKCGKQDNISKEAYENMYNKLFPIVGLKFKDMDDGTLSIIGKRGNCTHYAGGIKQMISHYMGIKNSYKNNSNIKFQYDNQDIYLGEIMYKFPKEIDKKKLENYRGLYSELAEKLNGLSDGCNITVLGEVMTYQDVFKNYNLDDLVKKYYNVGISNF